MLSRNILLTAILSFIFSGFSCNKLQETKAKKNGIKVTSSNVSVNKEDGASVDPRTQLELVSAFFWPSERDLETNQEKGLVDNDLNYRTYIRGLSRNVVIASNEFTGLTLLYLKRAEEVAKEEKNILEQKAPIQEQINALSERSKELRDEIQALQAKISDEQNEEAKKQLQQELEDLQEENRQVFSDRKQLKKELKPLKNQLNQLEKELLGINVQQLERSYIIQELLDPQAFSYVVDDDGNVLTNEYNLPLRVIDESKQVNYLKTYQDLASENSFDFSGRQVHIRLGWWINGQSYETIYEQDQNGNWSLSPESTIYDVSHSPDSGYLTFKLRERNEGGHETGQIFEFVLQRSTTLEYTTLTGDMIMTTSRGVTLRKGQFKALFF